MLSIRHLFFVSFFPLPSLSVLIHPQTPFEEESHQGCHGEVLTPNDLLQQLRLHNYPNIFVS